MTEEYCPEDFGKSQCEHVIKDPNRFCENRMDLQKCMLAAEIEWGISRETLNQAILQIKGLGLEEFQEETGIVTLLQKAIPLKMGDKLFSSYIKTLCCILQPFKYVAASSRKMIDNIANAFAKSVVTPVRKQGSGSGVFAQVLDVLSDTKLVTRANDLARQNMEIVKNKLRKGDVILVADHRAISVSAVGGALTHAMLYMGDGLFLHSSPDRGVTIDDLDAVFHTYDAMMILRPKSADAKSINEALIAAKRDHAKPYDTDYQDDIEKLYCTELIYRAYQKAGVKVVEAGDMGNKYKSEFAKMVGPVAIHPMALINSGNKVVWKSDNLTNPDANGNIEFVLGGINKGKRTIAQKPSSSSGTKPGSI